MGITLMFVCLILFIIYIIVKDIREEQYLKKSSYYDAIFIGFITPSIISEVINIYHNVCYPLGYLTPIMQLIAVIWIVVGKYLNKS